MNGIVPPNQSFSMPRMPFIPGMPGSYVPPWLVPGAQGGAVYPEGPVAPPFMPVEQMPLNQMAMMPPPVVPVYNRPFIPQPVLTNQNTMYGQPSTQTKQWMG